MPQIKVYGPPQFSGISLTDPWSPLHPTCVQDPPPKCVKPVDSFKPMGYGGGNGGRF